MLSVLANNSLDKSFISFINKAKKDFVEHQVNTVKFRRYLKRAPNLETSSLQPSERLKRRSITEQSLSCDKSVSSDQSDEGTGVSLPDEVDLLPKELVHARANI